MTMYSEFVHRDHMCSYLYFRSASHLSVGDVDFLMRNVIDMQLDGNGKRNVIGKTFEGRLENKGYGLIGIVGGIVYNAELDVNGYGRDSMSVLLRMVDQPFRSRN